MAQRTWIGGASAIAQVWKGTITTTTTGHTYIVTLTDLNRASTTVAFSYALVAADTTVTLAAASWVTAWNASVLALVSGITATSSVGVITLTADTAGVPFSAATSGTGTWSATGDTQASSGPNDWNLAANWAEYAVPTATDDVLIQGTIRIGQGLNQSAIALGDVVVANYSGTMGSFAYPLVIDPDSFSFDASGVAYVDIGSAAIAVPVLRTATPGGTSYGLYITGSAMTTITNTAGQVAVATTPNTTATVATVLNNNGRVEIGPGVTLTTLTQTGTASNAVLRCAATTVTASGGGVTTYGSGAITTLNNGNASGGSIIYSNSSGTITTLNAKSGTTDFSGSNVARTVTTLNLYNGAKLVRDPAIVTVTTLTQSDAATITAA